MEYSFYPAQRGKSKGVSREEISADLPHVVIAFEDSTKRRYCYYQVDVGVGKPLEKRKYVSNGGWGFDLSSFAQLWIPRWPEQLTDSIKVDYWGDKKLLKLIVDRALPGRQLNWQYEPQEGLSVETPYTRLHIADIRTEKLGEIVKGLFDKYDKLSEVARNASQTAVRRLEGKLRVA